MGKLVVFLLVVWAAFLSSCAAGPGTVEVTRLVTEVKEIEVTREVEVTRIVETEVENVVTRPVEVTRIVVATATLLPTDEPELVSSDADTSLQWAINYLGTAEVAGVTIELQRVLFSKLDAPLLSGSNREGFLELDLSDLWGEIVLKITNNSDTTVTVDAFSDGAVQINGEQINLSDYWYETDFGDDVSGDIFPGGSVIGGLWFPVKRTDINEITNITYYSGEVRDADSYRQLGPRIIINTEITDYIWEPIPED